MIQRTCSEAGMLLTAEPEPVLPEVFVFGADEVLADWLLVDPVWP